MAHDLQFTEPDVSHPRTQGDRPMKDLLTILAILFVAMGGAAAWFLFSPHHDEVSAVAAPSDPAPAPEPKDPEEERREKAAEPLPEMPKADPKSVVKALLPDNTLVLETKPDGTKRVLVVAEVCMFKPPEAEADPLLEVLMCKKNTKEHEAILRTSVDARYIHAALLAAGAVKGSPVQFVDPKTEKEDYKPASGGGVTVSVHYKKNGKLHTHAAQEWIRDRKTGKPIAHNWVFAGSRFVRNPDAAPDAPEFYTANNGEVISISNFPDAMLDLPVQISRNEADLVFEAWMAKVPPILSKVWVILEPVPAKKK